MADLLTRISGPLVGEPAPLRPLVEETLSGGWMRMLVLEREPRSRVSPESATTK